MRQNVFILNGGERFCNKTKSEGLNFWQLLNVNIQTNETTNISSQQFNTHRKHFL